MGWISLSIQEDLKKELDEIKKNEKRRRGRDPSFSELIDEAIDEAGFRDSDNENEKNRDFMELF